MPPLGGWKNIFFSRGKAFKIFRNESFEIITRKEPSNLQAEGGRGDPPVYVPGAPPLFTTLPRPPWSPFPHISPLTTLKHDILYINNRLVSIDVPQINIIHIIYTM